jgi:hypothetical protein
VLTKFKTKQPTRAYSIDEAKAILAALASRLDAQCIFGLAFFMGLRPSEKASQKDRISRPRAKRTNMIWNPWKATEVRGMLFDRIAKLNTDLHNMKACVEAERNLNEARLRQNQLLVEIILDSNRSDDFSVADLSMLSGHHSEKRAHLAPLPKVFRRSPPSVLIS